MSLLTIAWSMAAAACGMMGLSHIVLCFKGQRRYVHLLSSIMAFSAAAGAMVELALLHAATVIEYQALLHWENFTVYVLLSSMVWFVYLHFGTARRWLAIAITTLWSLCVIIDFLSAGGLIYLHIDNLRTIETFWGETFTLGSGPVNPWKALSDLASVLILIYVIDASVRAWRRGDRERAGIVGGSIVLFMVGAGIHTPLVDAGIVATPYMVSFAFLAIVMAMTYELVSTAFMASRYATQLQAQEARWRTLLENVQLLVVGLNSDGRTDYINPYGRQLLGFADRDIIGAVWIDRVVPQDDRTVQWSVFHDRLLRADLPNYENRIVTSAGQTLEVKWSNVVLYGAGDTATGILSIGENLTPRRHAEQEVHRQRDALAHLSRISALGEFAASLAHELNQPLAAMLSNAQAAQRFMAANPPDLDEVCDILDDLVNDNQRASAVIQRLRALVRKEHGEFGPVDIFRVVDDVVQLVHADSVSRSVHVIVDSPGQDTFVQGDQIQLQQVVLNLLLNAFDAVASLTANERRVSIGVTANGKAWEVWVSDQGCGLAGEILTEVFEPFFSTKRTGTGLGLSISRSIVEVHGGRLWAENNPDRGATFRFTIPASQANTDAAA